MDRNEIKELRRDLGLTQVQFAERLGVSVCAVQAWEQGKRQPRPDVVTRLSALRLSQVVRGQGPARVKQ